jgi:hypothetical protein
MSRILYFNRQLTDLADRSLPVAMGRSSDPHFSYFVEIGGLELDLTEAQASSLAEAGRMAAFQLDRALERDELPAPKTLFRCEDLEFTIFADNDVAGVELRCGEHDFRFTGEALQQFFYGLARLGGELRAIRRAAGRARQDGVPRENWAERVARLDGQDWWNR